MVAQPAFGFRIVSGLLFALCVVLLVVASVSAILGGFSFTWLGVHVSATSPARIFLQAAASFVVAAVTAPAIPEGRRLALSMVGILGLYAALVGDSAPRRVGDGLEYIAMARQLSILQPPALREEDFEGLNRELQQLPGYGPISVRDVNLIGRDGRQDLAHFWLYPLVVAPALAITRVIGVHWNYAFVSVNLLMLIAALAVVYGRAGPLAAVFAAVSPIIWWLDKAHPEVFIFSALTIAICTFGTANWIAFIALGLLAAQNPGFAVVLGAAALIAVSSNPRPWLAMLVAGLTAASSPIYYLWHLGRPSPLVHTVAPAGLTITGVLSPLIDPNIGVVYPSAAFLLLWVVSFRVRQTLSRASVALCAAAMMLLLLVMALPSNINSGGTPGPSRYGIWLLPFTLCLPPIPPDSRTRAILTTVALILSVAISLLFFHPRLAEQHLRAPRMAQWVMANLPHFYNPVPELFYERVVGREEQAQLPVATDTCSKVLIGSVGGEEPLWPVPCVPVPAPISCKEPRAVCYANTRGAETTRFRIAPRQPSFVFETRTAGVWRIGEDLSWLPFQPEWRALTRVPPYSERSWIRNADESRTVEAYQSGDTVLAFVEPLGDRPPRLFLRLGAPGSAWWLDWEAKRQLAWSQLDAASWVMAPSAGRFVLLARTVRSVP